MDSIGTDSKEELEFTPAKYWVNKHIYYKYSCNHLSRACPALGLSNESKPAVRSQEREPSYEGEAFLPESYATPGLLSYILINKFEVMQGFLPCLLPFYRQEKIFRRLGIELPRATMCNWAIQMANRLEPLIEMMKKDLRCGPLVSCDETPLQVLNEPGRPNTTKSFMWLFRGELGEKPIVICNYDPSRSTSVPMDFLGDFKGILLTDGYPAYNKVAISKNLIHAGCWVGRTSSCSCEKEVQRGA